MRIEKYGFRYWAVYDEKDELICVTVYKKGALEVAKRLQPGGNTILKESRQDYKNRSTSQRPSSESKPLYKCSRM